MVQSSQPQSHSQVETPKERIYGAHLIESHLVDQLFEDHRIIGKEVDAPLPIVKTDGSRDDLFYLVGITAADQAVLMHHSLAVAHGNGVPVHLLAAAAVHRVKAKVFGLW